MRTVTEERVERTRIPARSNAIMTDVEKATDDEHIVTFTIQELDEKGIALIGKQANTVHHTDDCEIREGLKGAEVGNRIKLHTPAQGKQALLMANFT